ncbi:MAG: BTAD domain-containing putative transcriptional regulator [Ilumatobacter sp.]|uniref:nSTAND1 domain-containing NTPase n=1 Tax=Ilumatobacter sp. TaxID=1967498 RepID=UPI003919FAA8
MESEQRNDTYEVQVLGPLVVRRAGRVVDVGGPKPSLLLALLVANLGDVVSMEALIDGLWGDDPPATARKAVQVNVSNVRRALGADVEIDTVGTGYRIDATSLTVDAVEFERAVATAHSALDADPAATCHTVEAALGLWNGAAYAEFADCDALRSTVVQLDELRLQAQGLLFGARLRLGDHVDVVGQLDALASDHPFREDFRRLHMIALYRSGRQAEALRAYQRTRTTLVDELGLEPSNDLRSLHQQILEQSPDLDLPSRSRAVRVDDSSDGRDGFAQRVRSYEFRESLGAGPHSEVFVAYHPTIGREVAVKVIAYDVANRSEFVRDFEAELRIVMQLDHPHIATLFDSWRDPDGAYVVQQLVDDRSLGPSITTAWAPPAALRLLDQVGAALSYAHRHGVAHGGIKPSNVVLDGDGNAYLTDFAVSTLVARAVGADAAWDGTLVYAAPEQLAGEPAGPPTDVYAFACLAFELLTGQRPDLGMSPEPVEATSASIPSALDAVFARATHRDPAQRLARIEEFTRAVRQVFGVDVTTIDDAPLSEFRNPYKGLRAFTETDAADFFGRSELTDQLVAQVARSPLTCVVGPSGSGKSSLVRAGLVPRARRGDLSPDRDIVVAEMFPGSYPFEELEAALLRVAVTRPDGLLDDLMADDRGLLRVSKQILAGDDTDLLLVIDQFEELFSLTHDPQVRRDFLDNLVTIGNDERSRVRLVLTMRADFFDRPLEYPAFAELMSRGLVTVAMPDASELAQAIVEPARSVDLVVESGLIPLITRDVADEPGALPLMQYALTELVEARDGRRLTIDAYERTGGVIGALARRAEEIYLGLPAAARTAAQELFVQLVTVDEENDDTRRRVRRTELDSLGLNSAALATVIADYGSFRLLSFDHDPVTRGQTIEVAHEALIREWPRLRTWIDERRESLLLERRLHWSTGEWVANSRDASFLLAGGRLEQYERWVETGNARLSDSDREFLDASRRAVTAGERSAITRRRRVLAVVACLAVLAVGVAAIAVVQRGRAENAASDARAAAVEADQLRVVADAETANATEQQALAEQAAAEAETLRIGAERNAAIESARFGGLAAANLAAVDPELATLLAIEAADIADGVGVTVAEVTTGLWESTRNQRIERRFEAPTPWIFLAHAFSMSPDGTHAVTTDNELTVRTRGEVGEPGPANIYDISTGQIVMQIVDENEAIWAEWDATTDQIAIGNGAGEISWWDPDTGDLLRRDMYQPEKWVIQIETTATHIAYVWYTGDRAPGAPGASVAVVVDRATGERTIEVPLADQVKLSPNGRTLALYEDFAVENPSIRFFDVVSGEELMSVQTVSTYQAFRSSDWIGEENAMWWISEDQRLQRIDIDTRTVVAVSTSVDGRTSSDGSVPTISKPGAEAHLASSADGRLFVVSSGGAVDVYDGVTLDLLYRLSGDLQFAVHWTPDGRHLVTLDGSERNARVWSLTPPTPSPQPFVGSDRPVRFHEQFGADLTLLADGQGTGRIWDTSSGGLIAEFEAGRENRNTRTITDTELGLIVTGSVDAIRTYDVGDRRWLDDIAVADIANPLAVSPDGRLLVASTSEGATREGRAGRSSIAIIERSSGEVIWRENGFTAFDASFVLDGAVVAVLGQLGGDSVLRLLDPESGDTLMAEPLGQASTVTLEAPELVRYRELAVSSDGGAIAVGGDTGAITLFDLEALLADGGSAAVMASTSIPTRDLFTGLAFSDDGSTLYTGSESGAVRAFATDTLDEIWSIDAGTAAGRVRVRDGFVWFGTDNPIPVGIGNGRFGVAAIPTDQAAFVEYARSTALRSLTDEECADYLSRPCS